MISLPKSDCFKAIVKPNSAKTIIQGYDTEKKAFIICIKAPADKDKANKELLRFLSRELGRKAMIKTGLRSREKVIQLL